MPVPRPRAAMRKIREALRLCLAEGLSPQAGAAAHRDPPGSISETHQAETARRDVASLAS